MGNKPWSQEMKNQIKKFGNLLLNIKRLHEGTQVAGLPARQLDMKEIDNLLEEFEIELKEFTELHHEWEAKQPDFLALQKKEIRLLNEANKINIQNHDDYEEAQKLLAEIQRHESLVNAKFAPLITAYEQKYKRLLKLKDRLLAWCRVDENGSA